MFDAYRGLRRGFGHPQCAVRKQRGLAHQRRLRLRQVTAQATENRQAVGIYIAPVTHAAGLAQPRP